MAGIFSRFIFNKAIFNTDGEAPPSVLVPNGNAYRQYQPTYHELRQQREIERKFELLDQEMKEALRG